MESSSPAATATKEWRVADKSQDIDCVPATEASTPEAVFETAEPTRTGTLLQALCLCFPAAAVPFAATIYSPLVQRLREEYGTTTVVYNLNITFALVGVGLAPLILTPLLERLDRKDAFVGSWLLFVVLNIGSAFVSNLGGLIVLRFFAFLFCGPVLSYGIALVGSLPSSQGRGIYLSLLGAFSLAGLAMGPVVGGLIEGGDEEDRRKWSRYLIPIVSFIAIMPFSIFGAKSVAADSTGLTGTARAPAGQSMERIKVHYRNTFKHLIILNVKEPIVIGITLYLSQLYFFFFVTLGAFPYAFGRVRGYGTTQVALTYLSLVVGIILSTLVTMFSDHLRSRFRGRAGIARLKVQPEAAMTNLLYCALFIPIGLFLFAWTAPFPDIHWAAPVIAMILFALGSNVAFTELNAYLAEVYEKDTSSALACPFVSQYLAASIAPLLTLFMIQRVTFQGSFSILAGVILALSAVPYILWWKGPQLRSRSVYAKKGGGAGHL